MVFDAKYAYFNFVQACYDSGAACQKPQSVRPSDEAGDPDLTADIGADEADGPDPTSYIVDDEAGDPHPTDDIGDDMKSTDGWRNISG
jgi:hypothetical protein